MSRQITVSKKKKQPSTQKEVLFSLNLTRYLRPHGHIDCNAASTCLTTIPEFTEAHIVNP